MRNILKNFFSKLIIAGEFIQFLWKRKLWWLIPIVIILFLLGLLLIFTQTPALLPFIYPLF
jgi:hypothetical protein